jgi:His-Xaa-Ser system radical SAM maturase HxsB
MQTQNPALRRGFRPAEAYRGSAYQLLPFKLHRLDAKYVLTNLAGEYIVVEPQDVVDLVGDSLSREAPVYLDLKARHFLTDGDPSVAIELLAAKYRTKQAGLCEFTALHIFVVSLRCDHSCHYCQVSRVSEDRVKFDMSPETASKAIDLMLRSPSRYLKVEFQGGEPLLNFEVIKRVVLEVKEKARERDVEFVIASNLSFMSDEILAFSREHRIKFSCSVDGPAALHNQNRPRPANDSYERTIAGISRIREKLGDESVAALMTTTVESLGQAERIIDEYVKLGFHSVFLRWISPYGFAVRSASKIGYDTERFLEFYKRGLDYILQLNLSGTVIREEYAAIILRKMLTPFCTGYIDLQSPSGLGLSVLVYNYDGDVYASDEGRMLAEMNDFSFRLGNVHRDSYEDLFLKSTVLETVFDTIQEGIPGCSDCAFSPYCGTDPVFNHATQGSVVGHRPSSSFCRRNMEIIRHLIRLLEGNDVRSRVLKSWAQ